MRDREALLYRLPVFYVALKRTHLVANRGYPQKFNPVAVIAEEDMNTLRKFFELMDLKWRAPAWWLVSYWS